MGGGGGGGRGMGVVSKPVIDGHDLRTKGKVIRIALATL